MDALLIGEVLSIVMFVAVIAALMMGYPVVFTLAGTGFAFGLIGHWFGAFDLSYFNALPLRYWGILNNEVLIAVPLFIYMGVMLERSGIAEDLLRTLGEVFGRLPGGLGFSVILVGALLAASTGIVGATVTTMALISLPAMLRTGYDKRLASGLICATGTLAQIIPPSTVLVFLAVIMQTANSQVQLAKGNFVPATLSVGDLFAGAFIPGLILTALYALWVIVMIVVRPNSAPAMVVTRAPGLYRKVVVALAPTLLLIIAVLGSIIAGIATPTEAASVGAMGAILLTMVRMIGNSFAQRLPEDRVERALFWYWIGTVVLMVVLALLSGAKGVLTGSMLLTAGTLMSILMTPDTRQEFVRVLTGVAQQSLNLTVMVFVIFLGATVFSLVFTRLGGEAIVGRVSRRHAGRRQWRGLHRDGDRVHPRHVPRYLRDIVHRGTDFRAGAAQHGCRPGLAVDHARGQSADQLSHAAVRLLAVLPARRGAAGGDDRAHLSRHHAVRRPADRGACDPMDISRNSRPGCRA